MSTLFFDQARRAVEPAPALKSKPARKDEYVMVDGECKVRCGGCGAVYGYGDSPFCRDGHGRVSRGYGQGFEPYFDYGLGQEVTGWGDIHKAMRENHLDFRDHPSKAKTEERLERIAERRARG